MSDSNNTAYTICQVCLCQMQIRCKLLQTATAAHQNLGHIVHTLILPHLTWGSYDWIGAVTRPPPTGLLHHHEICRLNVGVNQSSVNVCGWVTLWGMQQALSPARNAYLHTSCMDANTAHTPQSDARPHSCPYVQPWWDTSKDTFYIALTQEDTHKTDIFISLKHSTGYLIFIPKWPLLSTGILACSNQI